MKFHIPLVVCLLVLSSALMACVITPRWVPSSPLSPTPEPTRDTQTIELRNASPQPPATVTESLTAHPATFTSDIVRILEGRNIVGARWTTDGLYVQYVTREGEWWEYELATAAYRTTPPPFELDPQLWDQLEARRDDIGFVWLYGGLSPSGVYVAYNRIPFDYSYTPAPDEFYLIPYEIWIARSDGNNARSLGLCGTTSQVIWFEQEDRIIIDCGGEGPADIVMSAVDRSSHISLSSLTGISLSGRMALSPDETKLAITAEPETVIILTLDNNETQVVTDRGYVSGWSPDGQRLYYLRTEKSWGFYDLYVYDLASGTDTKLLSSPLYAADGTTVPIPLWVEVSPLENAIVFSINSGVWLVTWQPQVD